MFNLDRKGLFEQVSFSESRSIMLGLFSVVLYTAVSASMIIYQVNDVCLKLVYFCSVSVFPAIMLILEKFSFEKKRNACSHFGKFFFLVNFLYSFFLVGSLVFGYAYKYSVYSQPVLWIFYLFIIGVGLYKNNYLEKILFNAKIDKIWVPLFACTVAMGISCSLYFPFLKENADFIQEMVLLKPWYEIIAFFFMFMLGMLLLIWIFFCSHQYSKKKYDLITGLCCFLPILSFNVVGNFDVEHYNAYLGPAIATLHGKLPLVDVFCQYGLSYLVFTIAYTVFPNNYMVAAVVVSVLNIVCWIFLLLMLRKIIKNPIYFCVIAISFFFGSLYILYHDTNIIPSALCMRYFPMILVSHYLLGRLGASNEESQKLVFFKVNYFNAIVLLSIFWNIDNLISVAILYAAYLWITVYPLKKAVKKWIALPLFGLTAYAVICVIYLLLFGEFPQYIMYLKYIYAYINPSLKIGGIFLFVSSQIYKEFLFWIVFAVMNLVSFSLLISNRIYSKKETTENNGIHFINVVSILFMLYFVLQPSLTSFINSGYPSFIVLFGILAIVAEGSHRLALRVCAKWLLFIICFFFFYMALKSCFMVHRNYYKNGDLLYAIIHPRGLTVDQFIYNLTRFCSKKDISPGTGPSLAIEENTCRRNKYHQELYDAIEKWFPNTNKALLFHRDSVELLMEHHKFSPVFVNPANESFVDDLIQKTIDWIPEKIHVGDVVLVEKQFNFSPIEYEVLMHMDKQFDFALLEETAHLKIFKLFQKNSLGKTDLLLPLVVRDSQVTVRYVPTFGLTDHNMNAPVLFDYDKGTVWGVGADILRHVDTFWVWLDLGELASIERLKLWRKVDFRKPDYAPLEAFKFLSHFNIEISEDNKNWRMVTSEKGVKLENDYFYLAKIGNQKARYIRVNAFVDNPVNLSISEIEVFGKKLGSSN